jgi:hypothetical protein
MANLSGIQVKSRPEIVRKAHSFARPGTGCPGKPWIRELVGELTPG